MAVIEVASVERWVAKRARNLMASAGLSIVPDGDGLYADMAEAFDEALRRFGVVPAVQYEPSDDDLANLPDGVTRSFRATVLVEVLDTLQILLMDVDQQQGQDKQMLSQYAAQFELLFAKYRPLTPVEETNDGLSAGVVDLGFADPSDCWE